MRLMADRMTYHRFLDSVKIVKDLIGENKFGIWMAEGF